MSYQPQPAAQPLTPENERLYSALIHAGGIFFSFLPGLIGYLVLKDRSAFVGDNSRNALNFQITMAIAYVVGIVLTFLLIGIFVIFSILGAVAANRGEVYRYPLTIAFIK